MLISKIDSTFIVTKDIDSIYFSKDLIKWEKYKSQKDIKKCLSKIDSIRNNNNNDYILMKLGNKYNEENYTNNETDLITLNEQEDSIIHININDAKNNKITQKIPCYDSLVRIYKFNIGDCLYFNLNYSLYQVKNGSIKKLFTNETFDFKENITSIFQYKDTLYIYNDRLTSNKEEIRQTFSKYTLNGDIIQVYSISGYIEKDDEILMLEEIYDNILFLNSQNDGLYYIDLNKKFELNKIILPNNNDLFNAKIGNGLMRIYRSYENPIIFDLKKSSISNPKKTVNDLKVQDLPYLTNLWDYYILLDNPNLKFYNKNYKMLKSFKFKPKTTHSFFRILDTTKSYILIEYEEDIYSIERKNLNRKTFLDYENRAIIKADNEYLLRHQFYEISGDTIHYEYSKDLGKNWESTYITGYKERELDRFSYIYETNYFIPKLCNDKFIVRYENGYYLSSLGDKKFKDTIEIKTIDTYSNQDKFFILDSSDNMIKYFDDNCDFKIIPTKLPEGYNFNEIHYDQGYLYATDGYVLYRLKFEDEQVENYSDNSGLIAVSPNMASDIINVTSYADASENSFEVYDVSGRRYSLEFKSFDNNNYEVDISDLPKGKYFIRIEDTEISTSFYRE